MLVNLAPRDPHAKARGELDSDDALARSLSPVEKWLELGDLPACRVFSEEERLAVTDAEVELAGVQGCHRGPLRMGYGAQCRS